MRELLTSPQCFVMSVGPIPSDVLVQGVCSAVIDSRAKVNVRFELKDRSEIEAGPKIGLGRRPEVEALEYPRFPGKPENPVKTRSP